MIYGLNIIERDFKPIRFSIKFNLFEFISKHFEKWISRSLEDIDIKLEGLTRIYEKNNVVYWKEDYETHKNLVSTLQELHELELYPYNIQILIGSIILKFEKIKELAIEGESLSTTEYLNLDNENRAFLEKQMKETELIEVNLN